MSLQNEIDKMAKEIRTDKYPMSIGELASIYNEGDLDVHPEFQRIFRWDQSQKSNLIESILLGIPIPPIFVSQNENGVWDVIDGQQRLSTIFEFMGVLKDENGNVQEASRLTKTKFLPSLEGKWWESEDIDNSLTEAQRRYIKRSKLDITIIDKTSDINAKYELFQRLNTGGTRLSPQEIRNCLLVMINEPFYRQLREMNDDQNFKNCIPLSDNSREEQGDMEFIIRYLVARNCDFEAINKDENINKYLTDEIVRLAQADYYSLEKDKNDFHKTFKFLYEVLGEDVFKRYNGAKGKFEGPVLIGSFEAIILGVSNNIEGLLKSDLSDVKRMIMELYGNSKYLDSTKRGVRPISRFKSLSLLSLEVFGNED